MTIDKTLKVKRGATGNRSVLTRVERVEKLKELERWTETSTALGMPKVRVRKLTMKKKKKTKEEEAGAAAGGKDAKAPAAKGKK